MSNDRHRLLDLDSIPDSTLLDSAVAAELIDVKPGTLGVWACNKRYCLPYVKIGRLRRYRAGDLKAFIKSRTVAE